MAEEIEIAGGKYPIWVVPVALGGILGAIVLVTRKSTPAPTPPPAQPPPTNTTTDTSGTAAQISSLTDQYAQLSGMISDQGNQFTQQLNDQSTNFTNQLNQSTQSTQSSQLAADQSMHDSLVTQAYDAMVNGELQIADYTGRAQSTNCLSKQNQTLYLTSVSKIQQDTDTQLDNYSKQAASSIRDPNLSADATTQIKGFQTGFDTDAANAITAIQAVPLCK